MNDRITTISTAGGGWRALCAGLLLFFCAGLALANPSDTLGIDGGWRFHLVPGDAREAAHPDLMPWRAATVPGTVHTDLLAHGLIPDPYVGAPEANLQWIGLADWEYRTAFDVPRAVLQRARSELVFAGLDTFAEVWLNGVKLLEDRKSVG